MQNLGEDIELTVCVAFVDTETTGVARDDEAISVGILLVEVEYPGGRRIREVGRYLGYREPCKAIHPGAARVHGLTREALAGKSLDIVEMERLISRADALIAHNAEFDARMMFPHVPSIREKLWYCSWRQFPWTGEFRNQKLDTVCAHFGVQRPEPHTAIGDCQALAECLFFHTGKTARSRTYLGSLLRNADFTRSIGFEAVRPAPVAAQHDRLSSIPAPMPEPFGRMADEERSYAAHKGRNRERPEGLSWTSVLFIFFFVALLFLGFVAH